MITTKLSFQERAELASHPVSKKLFSLIEKKKTTLACALDVTDSKTLLNFVDQIGPHICVLKTHIDILVDFTPDVLLRLKELREKHEFLIFEDRKFADIGNTVLEQYRGGIYQISNWADITNCHILPGPGIISALKAEGLKHNRGLLLLAQMSSEGNLLTPEYTQKAVKLAELHADFVIGFVAQEKLIQDPRFLHFTPGIQLENAKDGLGQQFKTPKEALQKGSDILIVGRGIYKAKNPQEEAKRYQETLWKLVSESSF